MLAQGVATDDGGVGTDGCSTLDQRRHPELGSTLGKESARGEVVGKNTGGTTKNALLQGYPAVDRNIVLELAVVADDDIAAYEAVLPDHAPLAEIGTARDMAEVPDLRAIADGYVSVNNTGRVNEVV